MGVLKQRVQHIGRRQLLLVGVSFLCGIVWVIAIRFVTLKTDAVHYHANFAIFVNGERRTFDNPLNFEEVQLCGGDELMNPKTRAHMHDFVDHVVHVHDSGVTWGHFFANLGMTDGDSVFRIDSDVFIDGTATNITYVLNGELVDTTANRVIQSEDVLLVSIGNAKAAELDRQYEQVEKDAHEYNQRNDPSSCSGGKEQSLPQRIKEAFLFFQ